MNMKAKSKQASEICPRKSCRLWKWRTMKTQKYQTKAQQACLKRKKIDQSLNNKKTWNFTRRKITYSNNCKIKKRLLLNRKLIVKAIPSKHKTRSFHLKIRKMKQLQPRPRANRFKMKPRIIQKAVLLQVSHMLHLLLIQETSRMELIRLRS